MSAPRMLHIKAAPGGPPLRDHVYPHPFLPEDGAVVAEHPYWWRKLARGAAVLVVTEAEPVPADGTTRESDTIAGEARAQRRQAREG